MPANYKKETLIINPKSVAERTYRSNAEFENELRLVIEKEYGVKMTPDEVKISAANIDAMLRITVL